jgi:hypothetical protein
MMAVGNSPNGRPLTYIYNASVGSISGTLTTATLETSGASPGIITVTCTTDQQGALLLLRQPRFPAIDDRIAGPHEFPVY